MFVKKTREYSIHKIISKHNKNNKSNNPNNKMYAQYAYVNFKINNQ